MGELRLANISKIFKKRVRALDGLDLVAQPGELLALLGPSGCGKTTLLRVIAGLEKPDSGQVLLNGRSVAGVPPPQRPFALVFQNYALYPHMSARENLTYGLAARKVAKEEIARRLAEASELLRLGSGELKRKPGELSGGQRQRVALGKAIMRKPEVFLLDEPLSNLDMRLRLHLRAELRRVQRALKATMLLVTHDQGEAAALGDRIAILSKGKVVQVGRPRDLYQRPGNVFVAEFMANPAMTLVRGSLADRGEAVFFRESGGGSISLPLPEGTAEWARERLGQEILLGIRPEAVSAAPAQGRPAGHGRARLLEVEFLGPGVLLRLDSGAHEIRCLAGDADRPGAREEADLFFDSRGLFFFDPVSGRNLCSNQGDDPAGR